VLQERRGGGDGKELKEQEFKCKLILETTYYPDPVTS